MSGSRRKVKILKFGPPLSRGPMSGPRRKVKILKFGVLVALKFVFSSKVKIYIKMRIKTFLQPV